MKRLSAGTLITLAGDPNYITISTSACTTSQAVAAVEAASLTLANTLQTPKIRVNDSTAQTEELRVTGAARITGSARFNYATFWSPGSSWSYLSHSTLANNAASFALRHHSTGFTTLNSASGQVMQFAENGVEHSRIKAGGLWALGSTNPGTHRLHVTGSCHVTSDLTAGGTLTCGMTRLESSSTHARLYHSGDSGDDYFCQTKATGDLSLKATGSSSIIQLFAANTEKLRGLGTYINLIKEARCLAGLICTGALSATTTITAGTAVIGSTSFGVEASIWHSAITPSSTTVALSHSSSGETRLQSTTGNPVRIAVAGTTVVLVEPSVVTVSADLTLSGAHNLVVGGNSTTTGTKSFDIPGESVGLPQGSRLRHCCIESPYPDLLYRMVIDAPAGESEWPLPPYFSALNKNTQVWVSAVKHFGQAWGETDGCTLNVNAEAGGFFNVLVIGQRNDPAVQGYTGPFVAAP